MIKVKGNCGDTWEDRRVKSRNNPEEVCLRQKGHSHAGIHRD